jgi:hypothetical protein
LEADVAAFVLVAALWAGVLRAAATAFGLPTAVRAGLLRAAGTDFFVAFLIWRAAIEQLS